MMRDSAVVEHDPVVFQNTSHLATAHRQWQKRHSGRPFTVSVFAGYLLIADNHDGLLNPSSFPSDDRAGRAAFESPDALQWPPRDPDLTLPRLEAIFAEWLGRDE